MKINANFNAVASVHFDAAKYIPSPAYGVNRFMLDRVGNEKARATTVVQYKPNSKFPTHTHIGGEEFLVLEGTFRDQYGNFPAGTYVRNPVNSQHAPWVEEDGCTIFVKLLQMAQMENETEPLHVNLEQAKTERGVPTDYGTTLSLYHNDKTGEQVEMCWIHGNKELPPPTIPGGEELFIMDGTVLLESTTTTTTITTTNTDESSSSTSSSVLFEKWGWLRFPLTTPRDPLTTTLTAGPNGAQVYRKMGHLTEKARSMEVIQIDPETEEVID